MLTVPHPHRFEIRRPLGEGGAGIVYEAIDRERGERVALKMLRKCSPTAIARFKREFSVLHGVRHPNLVALGELVGEGDEWCFTMELVEGSDFLQHVRGGVRSPDAPAFDEARLREGMRQLTEAVTALHAAGLVHRDIKPSNIRVTKAGRVVLLDYGLVTEVGADRDRGAHRAVGTPAYMAPEQAADDGVGPEADWYSVGVLLYEALTGELPFSGSSLAMLHEKQRVEPPPPSARALHVPADLDSLCEALLRFDPVRRPSARRVLRVVSTTDSGEVAVSHTASRALEAPLVGRARELATLRAAWEDARAGAAVVAAVHGGAGFGKSRLAHELLREVTLARSADGEAQSLAFVGTAYEEDLVPFGAFDSIARAVSRALARIPVGQAAALLPAHVGALVQVFPALQGVEAIAPIARQSQQAMDPFELRSRAFSAMRGLLSRLAETCPLLVIIDDVDRLDADGRALLAELVRAPRIPRLLLVLTLGDASPSVENHALLELIADARTITLKALGEEDALTLASQLLERTGRADAAGARAIAHETQGHPFAIDARARLAALAGENESLDGDAIDACVDRIDPPARALIELLCASPSPVPEHVLSQASNLEAIDFARRLALLRVVHLVRPADGRESGLARPYHGHVRARVNARVSEHARRDHHRRLALAYEVAGQRANAEALAFHWQGAGDVAAASKFLGVAADLAAAHLAFHRAARLYEVCVELRKAPLEGAAARDVLAHEELRQTHAKLGEALANAGLGALAAHAFQVAAVGAPAADALDLRRRAVEQLVYAGRFEEGLAAIRAALASVGMRLPETPLVALVLVLVWRAFLRARGLEFRERDASHIAAKDLARIDTYWSVSMGLALLDNVRGAATQARHLVLALRAGERLRAARALALEVGYTARGGGRTWHRTEALSARVIDLAERAQKPELLAYAFAVSGYGYYIAGKFRRGFELFDKGHAMMRGERTMAWEIAAAQWNLLNCLVFLGELKELARRRPLYLREARERGDLYGVINLKLGHSNIVWLANDDPDGAREEVESALAQWSKQGFHLEHYTALIARANAEIYAGRGAEAYEEVQRAWPNVRHSLVLTVQAARILARSCRARCALAAGEASGPASARGARLLAAAESDARALEGERWGWSIPLALLVRAGVACAHGRDERARRALERAITEFEASDMALHAAAARHMLGRLLGGDEGRALKHAAGDAMRAQTVKSPSRMSALLAPGFARLTR